MVFIPISNSGQILQRKGRHHAEALASGHLPRKVPHHAEALVRRHYESISETFVSRVTAFVDNITMFTDYQKECFDVTLFVGHIFGRVKDFKGLATESISVRDFSHTIEDILMLEIGEIMIGNENTEQVVSSVETIDFEQIEEECGPTGIFSVPDLGHGESIFPSSTFLRDKLANGTTEHTYKNNAAFNICFPHMVSSVDDFPHMASSDDLWKATCESRHNVERLLVMTATVKTAQQLLLSSIIVVDDIAEMQMVASVLRKTMEQYNTPVCEFSAGVIWSGASTASIARTNAEITLQVETLRTTITAHGIVVTLRRTPVLNRLLALLLHFTKDKTKSPGDSISYHEDVRKFNLSVSLCKSAERVAEFKTTLVNGTFSGTNSKQKTSNAITTTSNSIIKKKTSDSIIKKKKWGATRFSKKPTHVKFATDTTLLEPYSDTPSVWTTWNFFDNVVEEKCNVEPVAMDAAEFIRLNKELAVEREIASVYRHNLEKEHTRLVQTKLPTTLGFILIMDDKDDDNNDQDTLKVPRGLGQDTGKDAHDLKKHLSVLRGREDPGRRMIKPHCTVMLTSPPRVIGRPGFASATLTPASVFTTD
jgi:hypothetical protein